MYPAATKVRPIARAVALAVGYVRRFALRALRIGVVAPVARAEAAIAGRSQRDGERESSQEED